MSKVRSYSWDKYQLKLNRDQKRHSKMMTELERQLKELSESMNNLGLSANELRYAARRMGKAMKTANKKHRLPRKLKKKLSKMTYGERVGKSLRKELNRIKKLTNTFIVPANTVKQKPKYVCNSQIPAFTGPSKCRPK